MFQSTVQPKDENEHWQTILKFFDRTNLKIRYSCMPNMNSYTYIQICNCNCHNKNTCTLPNSYKTKSIIYQAKIDCTIAGYKGKCYLGSCETKFEDCFGNHKNSFNYIKHENDMKLSKQYLGIKKHNREPKITWKTIKTCRSYNPDSKRCFLKFK